MKNNFPESVDAFRRAVLAESIRSLKLNTFLDNFDAAIFNTDGMDRSKIFNPEERLNYFDWFYVNFKWLFASFQLLSNDLSRLLYLQLICYRLAGHHSVRIQLEYAEKDEELGRFRNAEKSVPSQFDFNGVCGALKHFDFEYEGKRYVADCLGLECYLFRRQYFYSAPDVRIAPEEGDFVIDGGACTGDTALVFSNAVGPDGHVYSFDPVEEHLQILNFNKEQFPLKNLTILPFGLSNQDADFPPVKVSGYAPGFDVSFAEAPLRKIDSLVASKVIERVDFLKLDIEGSEIAAIDGASKCIETFKPKLAISLYHKVDDIFEIILHIASRFPFYKRFYIGHYTIQAGETVLYVSV